MNELIFFIMYVIKEIIEFIALKRQELHLKVVRVILILSSFLLLTLLWRGVLDDWSFIFRTFVIVSLISDIIMLGSTRIISTRK